MRDQETDREGMAYQSLVDLPLNQSRSSQLSCLGSGIPSLVGAFDSKKCGAGSSLSTSSGEREDVIQLDLQGEGGWSRGPRLSISSLWREVSFVSRVCWGGQGRWIGSRGDAYASSFSIGFPSFSVYGEGDKGEAPNMFYPQPPSVISNLNPLFLFTSTLRATTSSPFTRLGKG